MAIPVYSVPMVDTFFSSSGSHSLGGPDVGYVWVVRDAIVTKQSSGAIGANENPPILEVQPSGVWLLAPTVDEFYNYRIYQFKGRQVMTNGMTLELITYGNGYGCRVSGYNLTAS